MNRPYPQHRLVGNPYRMLWTAGAALLAGVLVYLVARPTTPNLIQNLLGEFQTGAHPGVIILPFAYQLPSFFHMLALMLATLAMTANQPALRTPAMGITFVLGIAMELVQHPAVLGTVRACTALPVCGWLPGLEDYANRGTFDPLDLAAIFCAALVIGIFMHPVSLMNIKNRHSKDSTS